ncbi:TRAP transporter permease [Oceanobacillus piezotolerans]|nr:TRAP transporter fused permease subunit [Oceanobacillus piezotolerans]
MESLLYGWFVEGYKRNLTGLNRKLFIILAFGLSVYQIWSVIFGKIDPLNQLALHLAFILALTFLLYGYTKKVAIRSHRPSFIDYGFVILAISAGIYFTVHAGRIAVRIPIMNPLTAWDIFFGLVFILLTIEATRRTIGFPIVVLVFLGFGYTLWGHHLNGLFTHREMSAVEFIEELSFSFNGLWGSPISVAASFVFMFMLFGAFLQKSGAGEFFFRISIAIAGRTRGGSAKVAVLASALFGSISGSPTANVVTTGNFTIPISKKSGYTPTVAAAVEAAASTGGSILPPVMGSSAFLMAAVTQMSYGSIVIAAVIPGILYYVSLFAMVHFEAMRLNLPRPAKEDIPKVTDVLKEGWFYFIPLIVLVFLLLQGYSASRTGFYGILAVVIVSWFRKETRMGFGKICSALVDGAKSSVPVTIACAAAGLIIAGIMTTGLGGKVTSIVLGLTEGMLFPTLILVMLICIVLGMGMPVAAAYILTAMLAAPSLIELGLSVTAAHLFIVYFSIFSAITPPVAVAAYAAAGIADANPNRVGLEAVKLGIVGFVVPYMFVMEPALLMEGNFGEVLLAFLTAAIGVIALAAGIIGWLRTKATLLERILLIIIGALSMYASLWTSVIGIIMLILVFAVQYKRKEEMTVPQDHMDRQRVSL